MSKLVEKERRRDAVRLHLENDHLIAIGHVAARAAMLDMMIELAVETLSKSYPSTLRKKALELSIPQKLELFKEALIKDLPRHENAISEFISEVHSVRELRHKIIHGIWRRTESSEAKELLDVRHWKPEKPAHRVTAKSMLALANQMIDLSFEMGDWKILTTHAHWHRSIASHGIPSPLGALPNPPRRSSKDG